MEEKAIMTLTDAAAGKIREIMAGSDKQVFGLRVGMEKSGCAGMGYTMEYAETADPADEIVESNGARILVDRASLLFLLGTKVDYRIDKLSSGFVFDNPNQTSACGCGESLEIMPASEAVLQDVAKS
jgi:iron-sulfur cluster assembly protein